MSNEQKFRKMKKVGGAVLASVLFASAIVGASFGYYKTYDQAAGLDTNFNDFVQIEADVEFVGDRDIKDAADSVSSTLDFLGLQNANVRTMGDDKLIINNPLTSYENNDDEIHLTNDLDSHFKPILKPHNAYAQEVASMVIPLFFDGTLDLRDEEGDAAFLPVSDDIGYTDYEFAGGVGNTTGKEGEFGPTADETGTESTSIGKTIGGFDPADYFIEDFLGEAKLTHEQGAPVIEIEIDKEGKDGNGYINMYKELDAYVDSMASTETPVVYVFWFNYDLTYDLVSAMDETGLTEAGSLYGYVSARPALRPLYVTSSSESLMDSKYSTSIVLNGSYSEDEAQYFVNKINNSNSFKYDNVKVEVVFNLQTKIMLLALAILILIMIITIIFAFVAYFGLLGLIASAVFVLITMIAGLLYSGTGILVTGLGLMSLGVIALISATIVAMVLNIYKNNNEDKFISVNKLASEKFRKIHSMLFSPTVATVLLFYGAGLVIPTAVTVPVYLIVIGLVISYAMATLLLFGLLYIMDLLTNWTRFEPTQKWNILVGSNKDFVPQGNVESNEKTSKWGVIATVVTLLVAVVCGGVFYGTTGSAINTNLYGAEQYAYVVEAIGTEEDSHSADLYLNETDDIINGKYGYDELQLYFEQTQEVEGEVKDAFKENGVKVSKIETIRLDEFNDSGDLVGSYGFQIYSRTALTTEKVEGINTSLTSVVANLQGSEVNGELVEVNTTFAVSERMSWNGEESFKIIGYTQNMFLFKTIYGVLLMSLITALILLFVGNWGVALAGLISTLLESILIISPLIILYLPISWLVSFSILLLAGLSFRNKILISKAAKNDEIESGKWNRAAASHKWTALSFSLMILLFEVFLIGTFTWIMVLPMIIVTLIAPFAIYLVQNYIYISLADKLSSIRNQKAAARLEKDIEESKEGISEEYIDGVNK